MEHIALLERVDRGLAHIRQTQSGCGEITIFVDDHKIRERFRLSVYDAPPPPISLAKQPMQMAV